MKPKLSIEIITTDAPGVRHERAHGWGDNAVATVLAGEPMSITLVKDGNPEIGFQIHANGEISITGYNTSFKIRLSDIRLEPTRNWKAALALATTGKEGCERNN